MKNRTISTVKERLQGISAYLFPLCFVFSALLNLVFFYLGFAYEENAVRKYGFILGCVLFAVLSGLALLAVLRDRRVPLWTWVLWSAVMLFFAVCLGVGFLKFGPHQVLLQDVEEYVGLSVPALFAGICGALRKGEGVFFPTLESFSFLAFPGALIYANSVVFDCLPWNYGADLGILNYMNLAYTFMPFLLAHLVCFCEKADWNTPFSGKAVRRPQLLRGVFIAVYWVAIVASATRGVYVCVAVFCALLVLSKLLRREASAKPIFLVSLSMAALLLFNVFIYAPPGMYRLSRVNIFLDGLKEGQLITTEEDAAVSDLIDELVQADGKQQVTNRPGTDSADPQTGIASENLQIGSRGTLFKLSIKEFLKEPVFGMGASGYMIKYGLFPHNVILELLCETGLVGTLVLMPILLYAVIRIFLASRKQKEGLYLFLFFVAYAIEANMNSCLWKFPALLCALGYGLTVVLPGKQLPGGEGAQAIEAE